jgi:hypothetical protein
MLVSIRCAETTMNAICVSVLAICYTIGLSMIPLTAALDEWEFSRNVSNRSICTSFVLSLSSSSSFVITATAGNFCSPQSILLFLVQTTAQQSTATMLGVHDQCSKPISESECLAYATSVGRQLSGFRNWGSTRPKGCFLDRTYDNTRFIFYNPQESSYHTTRNGDSDIGNSKDCGRRPEYYPTVCALDRAVDSCEGYFCDQTLASMFLFMTHNSYATPDRVFAYNQNLQEGDQFDAGIRGFNFDLYDTDGVLEVDHTNGDTPWTPTPYSDSVRQIKEHLERCEHRNEIVVVDLEMKRTEALTHRRAVAPWGDLVIRDFDASRPFSYYIEKGQRVLLLTNKDTATTTTNNNNNQNGDNNNDDASFGMHKRSDFVTQNGYEWSCNDENGPDLAYREGPPASESKTAANLMNHFCTNTLKLPDSNESQRRNDKYVLLHNARRFAQRAHFGNRVPNILMVDFYDEGDIWPVQELVRSGEMYVGDEWQDGTPCQEGTTCYKCQTPHSYWASKASVACGSERCWEDGTVCGTRYTTVPCTSCCSPQHGYWSSLQATACGRDCLGQDSFCWKDSSCETCCSGVETIDCPWYWFGTGCYCG